MDILRGLMCAPSTSNGTETAQMGHGDHQGMMHAATVKSEMAGRGDDEQNGSNRGVDGMTSSSGINSTGVEAAQLVAGCQHMCHNRRMRDWDSLASPSECPHWSSTGQRRARIKIEARKVNQAREHEMASLECACTA